MSPTPTELRTKLMAQTTMFSLWRNLNIPRTVVYSGAAADFFSVQPRQTLSLCSSGRAQLINPSRKSSGSRYNVPPSAEFVARVSGIPTMAKLPHQETADGLDAAFIGVPIDTGTSNRPGARWRFSLQLPVPRVTISISLQYTQFSNSRLWHS